MWKSNETGFASIARLDRRLYRAMNGGGNGLTDAFFKGVTELGSLWASVGASLALSRAGRRREALDALGAAGTAWLLGQALKKVWRRPRPYQNLADARRMIDGPRGSSWPSSHPAVLLAFVMVAGRNLGASRGVRAGMAGLAGVVGLSRVSLGVHYPADVAGGLVLGFGVADLWSTAVSPLVLGRAPTSSLPDTVSG
jgi:membrane-associated phospholipid phosphatase